MVNHTRHFKIYSRKDILSLTHIRKFETKLGETIQSAMHADNIENSLNLFNQFFMEKKICRNCKIIQQAKPLSTIAK